MDKCREAFEQYIRSQSGFTADFKIGCNGQYRSDLMHFMFITWQYQQKQIDELRAEIRKLIEEYKSEEKELELKEWEQSTIYGRIAIELEEALKGGEV